MSDPDERLTTVVFFHAHPDDEAIFTGGTIAVLAERGVRCVVVVATSGDTDHHDQTPGSLAELRATEVERACEILGAEEPRWLGYSDSGIDPHSVALPGTAFVVADVDDAAARLADILRKVGAAALVYYDEGGIYAHGDHLQVYRVGRRAAELAGVATVYESTVDREYLHFVETHVVDIAAVALHADEHGDRSTGVPTVFISVTADVRSVLNRKRAAMAAHASQIADGSPVLALDEDQFAAVYGYEWYVRTGPTTILDTLSL